MKLYRHFLYNDYLVQAYHKQLLKVIKSKVAKRDPVACGSKRGKDIINNAVYLKAWSVSLSKEASTFMLKKDD